MTTWVAYRSAERTYPGIYQDADDPRHWRVVVNLGSNEQRQRQRAIRVLRGKLGDAVSTRAALLAEKHKGAIRPQKSDTPKTVGAWMDHWLETYVARNVLLATRQQYQSYIDHYIKPALGDVQLRRLDTDRLQKWVNELHDRGLGDGTIFQAVARLRRGLERAVKNGMIPRNPMDDLDPVGRPGRRRLRVPSDDELRGLLGAMRAAGSPVYPLVRMALATGMREGELIALEWSSVDLKAGTVYVGRVASRVRSSDEAAYYRLEFRDEAKTEDSVASIPLDADTVAWLREWRKTVRETKLALRRRWSDGDGDLVFPQLDHFAGLPAGRAWQPGSLRANFKRHCKRADLGYLRFHDCRHIYGAVLYREGVPLMTISRLMRHKNIQTTANLYGHVGDAEKRAAVETLGASLRLST